MFRDTPTAVHGRLLHFIGRNVLLPCARKCGSASAARSMHRSVTAAGDQPMTVHPDASEMKVEDLIKKSRFVARVGSVGSAREAIAFVARVSDPSATHNCWAYRLRTEYGRSNDDGEPSGTAGKPIAEALESEGVHDTCVCVTRFYGGVKLGTGGLARAYGGAARAALRQAGRVKIIAKVRVQISSALCFSSKVYAALSAASAVHELERVTEAIDNVS